MSTEIRNWNDLAEAIAAMTPVQRQQPIQAVLPDGNEANPSECLEGIALGTVRDLEFFACRNTYNNTYCPDDVVLLLDSNPFAEDGAIAYEWNSSEQDKPIYGPLGKTDPADQRSPDAKTLREKWDQQEIEHIGIACRRRLENMESANLLP